MGPQNFNNGIKMINVRNLVKLTGLNNLKQLHRLNDNWKRLKKDYDGFLEGRSVLAITAFPDKMRLGLFQKDVDRIIQTLKVMLKANDEENGKIVARFHSTRFIELTKLGQIRKDQIMGLFIQITSEWNAIRQQKI
ncbi:MAG: hypothetical protein P0S95_00055 [Rhabdochlamydiaceae bacterium]|nr:hypothetical protein [Candidatus Amphrikana amoebophyrae]